MTEAQNGKYTPQKNDIDALEATLRREVEGNQQRIARRRQDEPGYQELFNALVDSQKRRCLEPNTRTFSLLADIVKETHMKWEDAVRRNNRAQDKNLKGEAWVRAIIDGID